MSAVTIAWLGVGGILALIVVIFCSVKAREAYLAGNAGAVAGWLIAMPFMMVAAMAAGLIALGIVLVGGALWLAAQALS